MFTHIKGAVSSVKGKAAAVAVGIAVTTGVAQASPPAMDAIAFPLDTASIGTQIAAAGGVMLGVWASVYVAFKLARKLIRRTSSGI